MTLRGIIKFILFPVYFWREYYIKRDYRCIELNGEKLLLTERYPLPSADVTKGKIYNMIGEVYYRKQVTPFANIPLKFYEILNDQQEPVLVSIHYFKKI